MLPNQVDNALVLEDAACAMLVGGMRQLRALDLTGQRHISTTALAGLPGLPELRRLALGSCPALCEDGYRIIACLTRLTELRLDCGSAKIGVMHEPDMPPKRGQQLLPELPHLQDVLLWHSPLQKYPRDIFPPMRGLEDIQV